jgi:hypothetical protein
MTRLFREADMYLPLRAFLEEQGYTVRSEVHHCDIAAVREDNLLIIEMKKSLNVDVLVQAVKRQKLTDAVYVAVPRPRKNVARAKWRDTRHLLRRLELGLMFVTLESPLPPKDRVQVVEHPRPFVRRRQTRQVQAILREISGRSLDYNTGGSTRQPLLTAYREQALFIATCLATCGPLSPKALRGLGTGDKTQSILANNVYGWFRRVKKGVYELTESGRQGLEAYPQLTTYYRDVIEQLHTVVPSSQTSSAQ